VTTIIIAKSLALCCSAGWQAAELRKLLGARARVKFDEREIVRESKLDVLFCCGELRNSFSRRAAYSHDKHVVLLSAIFLLAIYSQNAILKIKLIKSLLFEIFKSQN
jgi:hypothetical protein